MPILDQNMCDLYAAYLHMKTDDLSLIARVLGLGEIGNAIDLCGGYGRAALALQSCDQRWLIVDRSREMMAVAERLFEDRETVPEFIVADVERGNISVSSQFSTAFMLYNSINEVRDIGPPIALAARSLHLGGRFFLKCIVHDETYDRSAENKTATPFLSLFDVNAYGEAITSMAGGDGGEQTIELRFISRHGAILGSMNWKRWIHHTKHIDNVCGTHGLKLLETFVGGEYRLYDKTAY